MSYIIGLARNARLHTQVELAEASLADAFKATGKKQRLIGEFCYAAKSWSRSRQRLRTLALQGTELERASAATLRVRLRKIGAAIVRNTRRVKVMLATHHPLREVFAIAAARLAALGP